ncbi:MAG: TolC family protein [Deltaproteobacteria bacterium]|nr:TolC family protein [Deltaproteobacteria bacterium]
MARTGAPGAREEPRLPRRLRLPIAMAALLAAAPAPARAQELLTLPAAIRTALGENPSLAASHEAVEAADGRIGQAVAGFLPQVAVTATYRRSTQNSASPPWISIPEGSPSTLKSAFAREPTNVSYDNLAATISLNQTIWDFGRTLGAYRSAKASRHASESDLAAAADAVRLDVISAYFGVLAGEAGMAAAGEVRRQMERHLDLAKAQVAVGLRQRIDVTRAESDLATADLGLVRARNAVRLARVGLLAAMGVEAGPEFKVEKPAAPAEPAAPDDAAAVSAALDKRPEYKALRDRAAAAEAAATTAKSGWLPTLGANASYGHSGYRFSDLPYNWAVGLSLTWTAFDGLRTYHAGREAEANARAAAAQLRVLEVSIRTEVESAVLAHAEARESLAPARALVASATETLALAEGRYQAGTGNIVEVADAQAVYSGARTGLIRAEYDVETARARLLKATGDLGRAYGD